MKLCLINNETKIPLGHEQRSAKAVKPESRYNNQGNPQEIILIVIFETNIQYNFPVQIHLTETVTSRLLQIAQAQNVGTSCSNGISCSALALSPVCPEPCAE